MMMQCYFERSVFASLQHGKPFILKGNFINSMVMETGIDAFQQAA